MAQYINKDDLVAEIKRRIESCAKQREDMLNLQCHTLADDASAKMGELNCIQNFIDNLEVKDPYEQCVQYESIKAGIQAHAETYSFNIESKLFNQLTKEQQELWRKEIEQACISGGDMGVELARDTRYKENLEVKEVDLDFTKEVDVWISDNGDTNGFFNVQKLAKHFFELGLKAQQNINIDITNIDKVIEENGVAPNSKEAKIFKESYYIALEKLKHKKENKL